MNDDELAELLRRTLRHQADDLQPSSQPRLELVGSPRSRRVRATYVISGLVAAALVAVVASAITLNSNSGRTRLTVDTAAPAHAAPSTLPAPAPKPTVLPTTTTSTIPPLPEYQIPADFSPVSVTFVSSFTGWVLGSVSCETGECAYLAARPTGGSPGTAFLSRPGCL